MKHIGISGTRNPTKELNRRLVHDFLNFDPVNTTIVTGACLGIDALAARVAYAIGLPVITIVPADKRTAHLVDKRWRMFVHDYELMPCGTTNKDRNLRLVDWSNELYAYPSNTDEHADESRFSGTWQTIRMGRTAGKPVYVRKWGMELDEDHPANLNVAG